MTDSYESLLTKAYSNITEKTESSERFVVPEAKAYIEGKTTRIVAADLRFRYGSKQGTDFGKKSAVGGGIAPGRTPDG